MSDQVSNRRQRKSISRLLATPFQFIGSGLREMFIGIKEIGLMLVPSFTRGRRNRDFEKAGRDSQKVVRRNSRTTAFRKGERQRTREVVQAEQESRKLLNSNSKQAVEYREQLKQRKLEYSRGAAVNHLAMVNAKHRKLKASKEQSETDPESPGKKLPK